VARWFSARGLGGIVPAAGDLPAPGDLPALLRQEARIG
jgi:hypothetical protein